jgi:hypothetical protein
MRRTSTSSGSRGSAADAMIADIQQIAETGRMGFMAGSFHSSGFDRSLSTSKHMTTEPSNVSSIFQ